jgi:alpha-glucosidase
MVMVSLGEVQGMIAAERSFEFQCKNGKARLTIVGPKVIRVQMTQGEKYRNHESFARVPYAKSVSVISEEIDSGWVIATNLFRIRVQSDEFQIGIEDVEEQRICANREVAVKWDDNSFRCPLIMSGEDHFYGLGEKTGGLDKKGKHYEMWNVDNPHHGIDSDPLYQSVPFFIVLREGNAHGVFLDNTYRTVFDFGEEDSEEYFFGAEGGPVDYYIILGPKLSEVVGGYCQLTGYPHFVPRWALGYQQSRWMEYESTEDVMEIARELRSRNIPCDTIVLDIDYMNEYRVFTWDPEVFPDPEDFVDTLAEMNLRLMTIIDPGVKLEEGYDVYDQGLENGYFLRQRDGEQYVGLVWPGETVFPDFSRPEVRRWFGSFYKRFADIGVSNSSWIDMNEPSNCIYPGLREEYSMESVTTIDGEPWEPQLRNAYGLLMADAVYHGLRSAYPNQRPFILTRSGFSGYQRFASMWTGDNQSEWEYLWLSIPMLLNLGLSGIPFCGADVGGFTGDVTPELLARWYQVGCFYPFFRNHSRIHTARQEPWRFGEDIETITREYIDLRYSLLRYLYSLAWRASYTGEPMMRPLVFEFQEDAATYDEDTQFMIGPFLLIAPILEKGTESRDVYLPEGVWFDFWTGERFSGPERLKIKAGLENMPIYVRAGAIIPLGDNIQFTDQDQGDLTIWIYPGRDSAFEFYEDDGISEDGASALMQMRLVSHHRSITFDLQKRQGEWHPSKRKIVLLFKGLDALSWGARIDDVPIEILSRTQDAIEICIDDDGERHRIELRRL